MCDTRLLAIRPSAAAFAGSERGASTSAHGCECQRNSHNRANRKRVQVEEGQNGDHSGQFSMILCVTLNPCLDKTLVVPPWEQGAMVRGRAVRNVVGGKGNNVARALARLGRPSRPVTFLGGIVGEFCESLFRSEDRFDAVVIKSEASTREILTVRTEGTDEQRLVF